MIFTLEALQARHGDALLLHTADDAGSSLVVIDAGPSGVYTRSVRPRLLELRGDADELAVDLLMVSHLDDDHVHGVVDLLEELSTLRADREPVPFSIDALWLNHFEDALGAEGAELLAAVATAGVGGVSEPGVAVAASVGQGRTTVDLARGLRIPLNPPFEGLVLSDDAGGPVVPFGGGLSLRVLGPSRARLADLQKKWEEVVAKAERDRSEALALAAAYLDKSVFNLSSTVVVAEAGGKTMLLTGDARGDDTITALDAAGMLPLRVDLLKLPHHGSVRNVEDDYFENITADHYVISADGKYGNPDLETLEMLSRARGTDEFVVHLTNAEPRLEEFFEAEVEAGKRYEVVYREPEALSLSVDLGEPL